MPAQCFAPPPINRIDPDSTPDAGRAGETTRAPHPLRRAHGQANRISARPPRRRGMALLLVLSVVAVAAVIGYSILSSNALQAQIGRNALQGANAEYLAESGLHLALYQLQQSGGKTWSQSGITLPGTPGSIDVTVTKDGSLYTLSATGNVSMSGAATTLTHRAQAVVQVEDVALNLRKDLDLSDVSVLGTVQAAESDSGGGLLGGLLDGVLGLVDGVLHVLVPEATIPQASEAKALLSSSTPKTYTYQGVVYSAQQVSANLSGRQLGPTLANPLGIYYTSGNSLVNNTVINGSLFIFNGSLQISGDTFIIPQNLNTDTTGPGTKFPIFPALVVTDSRLQINGANRTFQVNGPTWLQSGIQSSSASYNMHLIFNGPLTLGGSTCSLDSGSRNAVVIRPSVKIVSWNSTVPAN